MVTYVYRDGKRLTPWMLYQINRLDTDIYKAFGVRIIVSDGIRTPQEQERIWYDRMVTAGNVRGRRVYETRWWNGQLWYRISALGTVAPPRTSNHEIQGNNGAVDIRDTGADAGVTVKSSARGRWIRANAHKYDLVAEGDGFNEGWHFLVRNIFKAVPSGGGSTTPATTPTPDPIIEEDDMPVIITNEKKTEASLLDPDIGRDLPQFKGDGKDKYRSVKVPGGVVNVYNGFMVTTSKPEMEAWGRNYCRAYGNAPMRRLGGDYLNGQVAASRYATEKHRTS